MPPTPEHSARYARTAERITAVAGAVTAVSKGYRKLAATWANYQGRDTYVVTVSDEEPVWADIHVQLLDMLPPFDQRTLAVRCNRNTTNEPVSIVYEGQRTHEVQIGGHPIQVTVIDGKSTGSPMTNRRRRSWTSSDSPETVPESGGDGSGWGPKLQTLQFDCPSLAARDAVIEWVAGLAAARRLREHPPSFHTLSQYGGWDRLDFIAPRPLSTVVLADGQMEFLVEDMTRFLAAQDAYQRVGLPWHRGYLLHGPPGNGKTTIPRALASHFNLDLWYAPLGDLRSDTGLLQRVAGIRTGGILLLEDIDVFDSATSRDESEKSATVSLSGLLNTLDGVATPPGLITIMTTNYRDRIDDALLRAGRADVDMEIGYLTDPQVGGLFRVLYDRDPSVPFPTVDGLRLCAAELLEACKKHLDDPDGGEQAIRYVVGARRLVHTAARTADPSAANR